MLVARVCDYFQLIFVKTVVNKYFTINTMAPRTAKAKKVAEVKVTENEAPKKGRGKAKQVKDIDQEVPEIDIDEKEVPEIFNNKKTKRGKKGTETNGEQTNGDAPPAKRGRKKAVMEIPVEEAMSNGDESQDEKETNGKVSPAEEQSEDIAYENGDADDEPAPAAKGRKKQTKKEEKSTGRGKKSAKENRDVEEKLIEDKPKGKGRGRKAQPKAEEENEHSEGNIDTVEETKVVQPAKGRKKGKVAKEKTPESEKEDAADELADDQPEAEQIEEPKKKETKAKKGQKKAQPKEDLGENVDDEKEPASKKRKVTKKEDKIKGESKDEAEPQESVEAKPAKGKRGKKVVETQETEEETQDVDETTSKRRRKPTEEKAVAEPKQKDLKNKSSTDYESIDFSNHSKNSQGKEWNFKIASWNVDGIRAWKNKGGLDYIKYEKPDILCLQEVKCAKEKLPEEVANLPGYHAYWLCSDQDGYAGIGIYTTKLAMNVTYGLNNEELDSEGRIITAEYEHFYLICTYVPNAGRNLVTLPKRLKWNEEFRKYVKELDKKKPVIICGDMNVAHNEIDLSNPKINKKNAGFTEEERAGMTDLLSDGFVDTYRHLNPDKTGAYTFWTYMKNSRSKNVGWRLDYFLVSERLMSSVCDNVIRSEVYGSDHCPLSLFLHLSTADKPKE